MRAASSQTVRLERGARSTHHVAWRGVRSQRRARPPPPRDGAGDGQEGRGATTGGPATRRCRRRLGTTVRRLGRRREHVWTLRRCATLATGKKEAGPQRAALQRGIAGGDLGPLFADWARGAGTFGHRGVVRRWRRARKAWGRDGRTGNEALPAENREHGLRIGHAARAPLDVAARRKSAGGRVAAIPKTGARCAKRAMWHGTRHT